MSANTKFATVDLNNGILEVFDTKEDAEKALSDLIKDGNIENEKNRDEYEEQGLEVPDANDFYYISEVNENGDLI